MCTRASLSLAHASPPRARAACAQSGWGGGWPRLAPNAEVDKAAPLVGVLRGEQVRRKHLARAARRLHWPPARRLHTLTGARPRPHPALSLGTGRSEAPLRPAAITWRETGKRPSRAPQGGNELVGARPSAAGEAGRRSGGQGGASRPARISGAARRRNEARGASRRARSSGRGDRARERASERRAC